MSGRLAWALLGLTVVLVPAGVTLAVVGVVRDPELGDGWESRMLLAGLAVAAALLFAVVGSLIARAEPRNAIGWLFLGAGSLLAAVITAFSYVDFARTRDGSLPGAASVEWLGNAAFIPAVYVVPVFVAQIFPDGRPLPGRWRWVLWVSVAVAIVSTVAGALDPSVLDAFPDEPNPLGVPAGVGDLASTLNDVSGAALAPAVFAASLAALVVRFRRSRGIERQQMKWLALAGAIPVAAFALIFVLDPLVDAQLLLDVIFVTGFSALMLIPVAVAVAILRYRLYEIDRVISRTLVYGSLTVVLGVAYVGLVLAGQALFSSFAGGSDLAIAGSTLVVAALFLPLRSRMRQLVDRRFYRRRYDAQRTLATFGARLREQIDLETLQTDLRAVVQETMQPSQASLWLRSRAGS